MHVHNSIMTFKQYLRTVQMMKNRSVDPKIPPEREGNFILIQVERPLFLIWMRLSFTLVKSW